MVAKFFGDQNHGQNNGQNNGTDNDDGAPPANR
jgi:hypothetical protein